MRIATSRTPSTDAAFSSRLRMAAERGRAGMPGITGLMFPISAVTPRCGEQKDLDTFRRVLRERSARRQATRHPDVQARPLIEEQTCLEPSRDRQFKNTSPPPRGRVITSVI